MLSGSSAAAVGRASREGFQTRTSRIDSALTTIDARRANKTYRPTASRASAEPPDVPTSGRAAARMARQGLTAEADSAAKEGESLAKTPAAQASPSASQNTSTSTVSAKVWNVFSRHRASIDPKLPAAAAVASVTAKARAICPKETPPNEAENMNNGNDAASSTNTLSRLASSFPKTSSLLVRFVKSSSSSVRRSFSRATLLAAASAEKNSASANCNGARI